MSSRGRTSTNPLDKKIPENPKYKHVRATVDTGASLSKYIEKMDELKRDYNFRKDEIFKRMKVSTFVQLVVQVADYDGDSQKVQDDTVSRSGRPDTADREVARIQLGDQVSGGAGGDTARKSQTPEIDTSRSRLEQVINGLGEVDLENPAQLQESLPVVESKCPYLLLDVREKDAYDECHIITAKSYPTAMLARSVNYETKDMLNFKNQPGKIILVYDEDERISHRAATTLVQRGYDNLFMLSGGLKVAYKHFPEGLITGMIPLSIWEEVCQSQGPKASRVKEPPQKMQANVTSFTPELIGKLCSQLDDSLSDRSVGSRLSKSCRSSRASSISSSTSVSTVGRKPFKF